MEDYWNQQVEESNSTGRIPTSSQVSNKHPLESEYDRHRCQLLRSQAIHANSGGWREELRRYLHDMPTNVTKDTDIVAWWAVMLRTKDLLLSQTDDLVVDALEISAGY
jgi:hypothetical protein